jgi:predicted transposase YbfD/YdcC
VKGGVCETEVAYYVTSVDRSRADAAQMLELCRDHWGAIENGVHFVRDVTFEEDRCRIFSGQAPQNLAAVRNGALNWMRLHKVDNFAARIRSFARNTQRLFSLLGFLK